MTSFEIKEKLIAAKAIHDREVEEAKQSILVIKSNIDSITDDEFEYLEKSGYDMSLLKNIDYGALYQDESYRQSIFDSVNTICNDLVKRLEDAVACLT